MQFVTRSASETKALAQTLFEKFSHHHFWCLYGPLGAGKTVFAKGLGHSFGIAENAVKSPTYIYVWEHSLKTGGVFYHCDLYRASSPEDWFSLGLHDRITKKDFILIEWADRIAPALPAKHLELHFTVLSPSERSITVSSYD